jgi:hypothetical protein
MAGSWVEAVNRSNTRSENQISRMAATTHPRMTALMGVRVVRFTRRNTWYPGNRSSRDIDQMRRLWET